MTPPQNVTADGAIALTGGAGHRIAAGVQLVETGAVSRLLVSGVDRGVSVNDIIRISGGDPETYACCVDLGYVATSTHGNAEESAAWAALNGYDELIVVTSDYHLPRSLIHLARAMPETALIAYPVRTEVDPSKPFANQRNRRGLLVEWFKWRVTRAGGDQ